MVSRSTYIVGRYNMSEAGYLAGWAGYPLGCRRKGNDVISYLPT